MTPTRPLPSPPGEAARAAPGQGLISASAAAENEDHTPQAPLAKLPVELDVVVPIRDFRVRHLFALTPGELIESRRRDGEDVPLAAGNVQLAWSESEVIDT